jgi:hypothetical protein
VESNTLVNKLEEILNLIDKIEGTISRLKPGDQVSSGLIYQLYETIILLREKVVEVRIKVTYCRDFSQ